jgi:hypothetical protein
MRSTRPRAHFRGQQSCSKGACEGERCCAETDSRWNAAESVARVVRARSLKAALQLRRAVDVGGKKEREAAVCLDGETAQSIENWDL